MKKIFSKYNYVFYCALLCFAYAVYANFNNNTSGALYFATTAIFFLGISMIIDEIRKIPSVTINMNGKTEILTGNKDEHRTPNL